MPGPQTYAATLDERLYGDKRRYTTHRFVFLPLPTLQFRFLWKDLDRMVLEWGRGEFSNDRMY